MKPLSAPFASAFAFLLSACVSLAFAACTTVPEGTVGVVTHWSKATGETFDPGLHGRNLFTTSVFELSTRVEHRLWEAHASSSDLQQVTTSVGVEAQMPASAAVCVFRVYSSLDGLLDSVGANAVQESVKAATAHYTAEQLITQRVEVKTAVEEGLRHYIDQSLTAGGCQGALVVNNVAIRDFAFSEDFNKAIEAKVTAEQQSLQAEKERDRRVTQADAARLEAEKAADGAAYAVKQAADAKAYAIRAESVERAAALQREAAALTAHPDVVRLRAIERWNGALPATQLGAATPIIDLR